jgi:hypothetical protein
MLGRTTQRECRRCKAWCTLCLNGYSQQVQLSQPCFRTGMGTWALVLLFMSASVLLPVRRALELSGLHTGIWAGGSRRGVGPLGRRWHGGRRRQPRSAPDPPR